MVAFSLAIDPLVPAAAAAHAQLVDVLLSLVVEVPGHAEHVVVVFL
jgi:hypothetical protein